MKRHIFHIFAVMAVLLSACSESPENRAPSGKPVKVGVQPMAIRKGTGEANANDLIKSWWVVFVGSDNVVYDIVGGMPATPSEQDFGSATVPPGDYTVYGFANITPAELTAATGLSFSNGQQAPDVAGREWSNLACGWAKDKPVPMSGFKTVTVTERVNQNFSIEVVRLLAKMEFRFTSRAAGEVKVDYVSLIPMLEGPVRLMPDYGSLGSAPSYTPVGTAGEYRYNFAVPLSVASALTNPVSEWFYVREAVANSLHPTGHFVVHVGVRRQGRESVDELFALADELTYINRNDHIVFPIVFSDYIVEPGALFYPPIGGYPAVAVDLRDNECYMKFGTQGRFVLNATVRDAATGALLSSDRVEVNILNVSDPDGILSASPAKDPVTGEMCGELNTRIGTAIVGVEIKVLNEDRTTYQIYNRTIYIIRENQ